MNFINRHLIGIAIGTAIISILWVLIGPYLLTHFSWLNFAGDNNNTGLIGDTFGGICSPVVGLASVILLFLALIKQSESNQIIVHEANFRIVYSEIEKLRDATEEYKFGDSKGRNAVFRFAADYAAKNVAGQLHDNDYEGLNYFELHGNSAQTDPS